MLLIGSSALQQVAPALLDRSPLDFDFICTEDEAHNYIKENNLIGKQYYSGNKLVIEASIPVEFELVEKSPSGKMLYDMYPHGPAPLEVLYLLKKSHRYLKNSPHFWKTCKDYHVMKSVGITLSPELEEILKLREIETYTYKHPNLNVTKKEFFNNDQVAYKYDHDSIHEAVKHLERPAYTYFGTPGTQVKSSKKRFFEECNEQVRLLAVLEESYVLSIERSQVPFPGALSPAKSFSIALSKVCSSITSGWFREYAYENVFTVVGMYNNSYLDVFNEALAKNKVKLFNEQENPLLYIQP